MPQFAPLINVVQTTRRPLSHYDDSHLQRPANPPPKIARLHNCFFLESLFTRPLMSSVLQLLLEGEPLNTAQMAQVLGLSESEIEAELTRLKAENVLLGWRPVFNPDRVQENLVRAVIEVKISPERDGGFDRLATRIARFDAVESCFLMSGAYDLLVFAVGKDLREVASFVSERLSTVDGVLSTATHFMLRAYKEQGYLLLSPIDGEDKPAVSP
jgi:DNA-binding Lrp family transcriptional regulator